MSKPETTNLLEPVCAGASLEYYAVCPRCGATPRNRCWDNAAYDAQYKLREPNKDDEVASAFF